MEIEIRKAIVQDYRNLLDLFGEVDALHHDNLPQIFQKPTGSVRDQDYFLGLIGDENVGLFVAKVEGKLVGFIHAVIRDTPAIPVFVRRRYAVIDNITVSARYRRNGIGQMLMHRIDEWAIAKGATAIELNVYEFNRVAIAFYQGLGYETLSRRMSRFLNGG